MIVQMEQQMRPFVDIEPETVSLASSFACLPPKFSAKTNDQYRGTADLENSTRLEASFFVGRRTPRAWLDCHDISVL